MGGEIALMEKRLMRDAHTCTRTHEHTALANHSKGRILSLTLEKIEMEERE